VQYAEARRKLRPKSENQQGKEAALTHTNGHKGLVSEYSTMTGLVAMSGGPV
jgi:hypothetical protein